ncbi:MAG: aminoacyl-tRNA hydrolase [Candidatus Latescibacteria bacterium]|nr:aminoacyl-tRNA hydrolase [Candidatus Latescibacterota bacterium]
MKAIVGLGNPGARYVSTRHNVGFRVVEALLKDAYWHAFEFCVWAKTVDGVLLVKPLTYMNSSGLAVAEIARCFQLDLADILVVIDDVHLNAGRLRFRRSGSHGGHNGLRSIQGELGSSNFPRLRLGIGQPSDLDDLMDHVLGAFSPEEADVVTDAVCRAANGAFCWATQGVELAMNQFNAR